MNETWREAPDEQGPGPAPSEGTASTGPGDFGPGASVRDVEPTYGFAHPGTSDANYGDLATIIRLQSTQLERLAAENERLMARLEAFFRVHEHEQKLRQQLERQIEHLSQRVAAPQPACDLGEIRREARESVTAEIKPVLVTMVDLLERTLKQQDAEAEPAPGAPEANPGAPEANPGPPGQTAPDPLACEGFLRLPEILTRPLEDLTTAAREGPGRANGAAAPRGRPPRESRSPALPAVFSWTNFFT